MKALSMAILNPGRPENFPPPSRGRSRSSRSAPVLYRGGGDQEPRSPKVTCIGQVRARKSRRRRWSFLAGGRRVLRRWVVFLRSGYCKRVDAVAEVEGSGKFENVLGFPAESGIFGEEGSGNPRNLDGANVGDSEGIAVMVTGCAGDSPCRALSLREIFLREGVGGDGVAWRRNREYSNGGI